jgi:hypothetical protein
MRVSAEQSATHHSLMARDSTVSVEMRSVIVYSWRLEQSVGDLRSLVRMTSQNERASACVGWLVREWVACVYHVDVWKATM